MLKFEKNIIGKQAKELGFVRDTFEKVCRLADILKYLADDSFLKNKIALKGGTAINLTMMDLPRLSVDIDLDYVGSIDRTKMLKEREEIKTHIAKYMEANEYKLSSKSKEYYALDSFVYDYWNAGGVKDNLKIEINYMLRTHILDLQERKINLPWEFKQSNILCVNPIEIYSTKIIALLTRTAARDLYDVYNMVTHQLFDEQEITKLRNCVIFYSAISTDITPNEFVFDNICYITQQKIKTDLYPVLRSKDEFNLKEAQEITIEFLKNVLIVDDSTAEFWNDFKEGKYRPELMLSGMEYERVKCHPMALWKCKQKV